LTGSGRGALGIIETQGRAPLIEAVDTAIKAAPVRLLASYFVGGGCNTVTLVGDVGAIRAALDAAWVVMNRQGIKGCIHLIPRLAEQVWPFISPVDPDPYIKANNRRNERRETRHGTV
jgi:energy-coupling factor transport system substrate-specific component